MRDAEMSKKYKRVVMCKIFLIEWMQLLVNIWRDTETNGKQQLDLNHEASYRDQNDISANSLHCDES